MSQYREFRYWSYDFTGEGISYGDGLNGFVVGVWPLTPGEHVDVFTRKLVFLGTDGNDGGLFQDKSDGSIVYLSDVNAIESGGELPEPINQELNFDGSPGKMLDDGGDPVDDGAIDGTSYDDDISPSGVSDGVTGGPPGNGADTINGFAGADTIDGGGGDDLINGGNGHDSLLGAAGQDTLIGGNGNDVLEGGDHADDLQGKKGEDTLRGDAGKDTLNGGNGNDVLVGGGHDDKLFGGNHRDKLTGGAGTDEQTGGNGNDTFIFKSIGETDGIGDIITDFGNGNDVMDVSQIDAKTGINGNQAFEFIGTNEFTKTKGELRYEEDGASGVEVYGDVDGDGDRDFTIRLEDISSLTVDDFIF